MHPICDYPPTRALTLCCVVSSLILSCLAQPLVAYDFSALTALAEGALQGDNVRQPVAGFEIRLLKDGDRLFHQTFGDWSLDRPANADSSTKTFSGALVMSLMESGELGFSLDSRLGDFLAEYDNPQLGDITIRQSFSHTSGIAGEDVFSLILLNPNITLRQAALLISQQPLAHGPPGSTFAYGGLSMQAAGAAAEVASGKSYIDLFSERIAVPLELADTRFVIASDQNPRVAGGIESTATDYARFMDMLLNQGVDRTTGARVLRIDSVEEMLRRQTTDEQPIANSPTDNNRYGIGVWLDQLGEAGPEVDVLAAGARGFHSWIDSSEGLVFTFSTDLTQFSNVELLSSKMHMAILQAVTLPGDFNVDGVVDAADYVIWRKTDGTPGGYDLWRANFGQLGGGGSVAGENATVPEPATLVMLMLAPAGWYVRQRRGA
jgi:CubicO group peptidase (beta-lactamase class C family)